MEISRVNERVMSNNVGSINDRRINVKNCASRNGLKLQSANTTRSMRCNTAVQDRGRRLNQSQFRSMAEVSFLPSATTRKRASPSRETFKLFACENVAFFRIERSSISITWNRGKCGDIHPKFFKRTWLRELAGPYTAEISLLRSVVASQQWIYGVFEVRNLFQTIEMKVVYFFIPKLCIN